MHWLALIVAVLANVAANVAFKKAMTGGERIDGASAMLAYLAEPWLWAGGLFAGLLLACYLYALQGIQLPVAYPVVTGLAMLGIAVAGITAFGEQVSVMRAFAMLLIVSGVVLLRQTA